MTRSSRSGSPRSFGQPARPFGSISWTFDLGSVGIEACRRPSHVVRRMLVILSPDSVESENVMDELSFALEKKVLVIPVLYRDCEIPFRIGRVQYVDFRSDHDKALKELLDTLNAIERDEEENSHNIGEDKEDKQNQSRHRLRRNSMFRLSSPRLESKSLNQSEQ